MKPFRLPPWKQQQLERKYARQDRIVKKSADAMLKVMENATDYIIANIIQGIDHFPEPTLNDMYKVSEDFYHDILMAAIQSCKEEKAGGKKRLAKGPVGLPKNQKMFDKLFGQNRFWRSIMRRSKKETYKLRQEYLKKLRDRFQKIVPQLKAGELTPKQAKDAMMEGFRASRSRVETVFRTETTNYFGKAQVNFFSNDNDIIGFLFDSVRDTSRTDICRSRHGLVYRPNTRLLDENTPACHYNCRSHLIALANTEENRKMLKDPKRDPSKVKVEPLPPGWRK